MYTHMQTHMHAHIHNIIILYLVFLGMRRMEECEVLWIEWASHSGLPFQPVGGQSLCTDGERMTTELLKLYVLFGIQYTSYVQK